MRNFFIKTSVNEISRVSFLHAIHVSRLRTSRNLAMQMYGAVEAIVSVAGHARFLGWLTKHQITFLISNKPLPVSRRRHVLRAYFKLVDFDVAVKGVHFEHAILFSIDSLGVFAVGDVFHCLVPYSPHHDDAAVGCAEML